MNINKSVDEGYTDAPIAPIAEHRDQWHWFLNCIARAIIVVCMSQEGVIKLIMSTKWPLLLQWQDIQL